jgi:hypothetical protein
VSGYWGEKLYPEGFILIEPKVAEKAISLIINDEYEAADELARLLLVLERGIEAEIPAEGQGRCPATRDTIAMMVELVYLESAPYHGSLKEWREALTRKTLESWNVSTLEPKALERLNVSTLGRSEGESCQLKVESSGKKKRRRARRSK